jgi:hypothetical protein
MSRRKGMEMSDSVEDVAAMEAEIFKERLVDGLITGLADPTTDLMTRAEVLAMTTEGLTPEEIAIALRDKLQAQAEAQAAEAAAAEQMVPAAGPPPGAPAAPAQQQQQMALPPLPGRTY